MYWNLGPRVQRNNYNAEYSDRSDAARLGDVAHSQRTNARDVDNVCVKSTTEGESTLLPMLPSLAGSGEVTRWNCAGVFDAGNTVSDSTLGSRTDQSTARILETRRAGRAILTTGVAFMMKSFERRSRRGNRRRKRLMGIQSSGHARPDNQDYKTGFVGYTGLLAVFGWLDNQTKLGLSGAQAALPIWTEFMKNATASMPVTDFVAPPIPRTDGEDAPKGKCGPDNRDSEPGGEVCPPSPPKPSTEKL